MADHVFQISGDASQALRASDTVLDRLERIRQEAQRASQGMSFDHLSNGMGRLADALRREQAAVQRTTALHEQLTRQNQPLVQSFGSMAEAIRREQAMLESIHGPARRYAQDLQTLDSLQRQGKISAQQHAAAMARARREMAGGKSGGGGGAALASGLRGGLAAAGIGIGAAELIGMSDSVTNLQNRLRGLVSSQEEVNVRIERLRDIANATRSDLSSTGEAYVRITRATQSLGISTERVFGLTETLGKALAMSGATSSEASAGMLQLAQAMSSGRLQGDELRSVLENIPIVAEAIEKSLGVDRAGLRKLAEDGKITTAVIVEAFEKAKGDIDKGFGNTIPTISQQMAVLKNDISLGVGEALASVTPHINAMTQALEENVRKRRRAIEDGTLAIEKLMGSARGMLAVADAEAAGIDRAREAIERFGQAGDVSIYRARKAIEDFVAAGDVEKLADQWNDAREAAVKAAEAMAAAQGLGPKDDMGKQIERGLRTAAQGARALEAESKRAAESAKKLREEYEKLGQALLGSESPSQRAIREGAAERARIQAEIEAEVQAEIDAENRAATAAMEAAERKIQAHKEWVEAVNKGTAEAEERRLAFAEKEKQAAEEVREAWAQGLGSITADLINMAMEGEFSVDKLAGSLARLAFQIAAMQIGGPWGAFVGALGSGLGGNMHGGDHVIGGRPFETFGLPKAQFGADWRIGGPAGPDRTLVAFWGSRDETVSVRTPGQRASERMAERRAAAPVPMTVVVQDDPRQIVASLGTRAGVTQVAQINRRLRRRG